MVLSMSGDRAVVDLLAHSSDSQRTVVGGYVHNRTVDVGSVQRFEVGGNHRRQFEVEAWAEASVEPFVAGVIAEAGAWKEGRRVDQEVERAERGYDTRSEGDLHEDTHTLAHVELVVRVGALVPSGALPPTSQRYFHTPRSCSSQVEQLQTVGDASRGDL